MKRFEAQRAFLKTDFHSLQGVQTGAKRGELQPPAEKAPEAGQELYPLPEPVEEVLKKRDIWSCIRERRSVRRYSGERLSLPELSYLLWATQGVSGHTAAGKPLRTVPSAGMTYTLETYLLLRDVEGLSAGIYRYQPFSHSLLQLRTLENSEALIDELTMGKTQPFLPYFAGKANAVFVWSTVPYRSEWKFDTQAHKKILLDAGHVCQNLYLAAESIDAGACALGIYEQKGMDRLLGLDGEEEFVIYLAAVGKK